MATRSLAVQIERPNDYYYDPVYTVSGFGAGAQNAMGTGRVLRLGAVSGANRFKYFRTPAVTTLRTVPPEVLLSVEPVQMTGAPTIGVEPEPAVKTVATQSDYRESETQTDPYTPNYVMPQDGTEPELLHLQDLTWGRGLPAGVAEIEMIERARKRRAFEASLPEINEDPEIWRRLMEMQQMEEMARREAEIQSLQEQRLEVIKEALKTRDMESKFVNEQRMEELKDRGAVAMASESGRIQRERLRELRKIAKARQQLMLPSKRDIIREYADHCSTTYAPLKREGRRVDKDSKKFETTYLQDLKYQDVVALAESLPRRLTQVNIERPRLHTYTSAAEARRARAMHNHLERISDLIKRKHAAPSAAAQAAAEDDDLAEYRKAPIVVRPPTPELRAPVQENDERRLGVVLLQRLLRGRAVQNDMFGAKERRQELIRELRTVEALVPLEEGTEREALLAHQQAIISGHVASAVGREVSQTLDYLNKELARFKEERRIHAMVMLAERQRSMREAEEKGKRAEEEVRRAKQDALYRQVMLVHQGTVDTYLESVLGGAVESAAKKQAMIEANARAAVLNDIVDSLDSEAVSDEDVVRDLVGSFLLPEVSRAGLRGRVRADQGRLVAAAHEEVVGALVREGLADTV